MFENTVQCIKNCFNTQSGTHIMYRSFGLNITDEANPPIRRDCQIQLATYYPTVSLSVLAGISITSDMDSMAKGEFKYNITLVEAGA